MKGDATAHARAQAPVPHALCTLGALVAAAAVTTAVSSSRSMLSDLNASRCYLSAGVPALADTAAIGHTVGTDVATIIIIYAVQTDN